MDIAGRIAVVTGANSGLGKGASEVLSNAGATVIGFDIAEEPRTAVSALPTASSYVRVDVSEASAVQEEMIGLAQRFGRIDIAVNCAEIASTKKTVSKGRVFPFE